MTTYMAVSKKMVDPKVTGCNSKIAKWLGWFEGTWETPCLYSWMGCQPANINTQNHKGPPNPRSPPSLHSANLRLHPISNQRLNSHDQHGEEIPGLMSRVLWKGLQIIVSIRISTIHIYPLLTCILIHIPPKLCLMKWYDWKDAYIIYAYIISYIHQTKLVDSIQQETNKCSDIRL